MQAFNISQLKNNPSTVLSAAHDDGMVVLMKRLNPTALLVDLEKVVTQDLDSVKVSIAILLFKEGVISLGSAARIAKQDLSEMMTLLSSLDIPLTGNKAKDIRKDMDTLRQFINKT